MSIQKRLLRSKSLKVFLIALVLVFSFEVNRPKAFVPLAWAGAVLVGMAAETLVTAGVKAGSKAILKKKADEYGAQALKNGGYDFLGTNPYRNKDGSITLSPTANDRAKMAGLISGALIGSMYEGSQNGDACLPGGHLPGNIPVQQRYFDPAVYSEAYIAPYKKAYDLVKGNIVATYDAAALKAEVFSAINGKSLYVLYNVPKPVEFLEVGTLQNFDSQVSLTMRAADGTSQGTFNMQLNAWTFPIYEDSKTIATELGEKLILCDGLIVPSSIKRIYPVPPNMSSTYQMPNKEKLNFDITLNNIMPPSTTEGEITWDEIEQYYVDSGEDFIEKMNGNIDTFLANGDINNVTYKQGDIYNIYTDYDYPEKVEDFNPELETGLEPVPDGDLPAEIEPVAPINRGMLQVMKESYAFLADGVQNSIDSMKTVTDSATGLINYLDTSFRWLPAEWRAMFGAAFVLGVFAHFFRR